MSTTHTPTLGQLVDQAQTDALNGLAYLIAHPVAEVTEAPKAPSPIARRFYAAVQVADQLDPVQVIAFGGIHGQAHPGIVHSVVTYAALRDAFAKIEGR